VIVDMSYNKIIMISSDFNVIVTEEVLLHEQTVIFVMKCYMLFLATFSLNIFY